MNNKNLIKCLLPVLLLVGCQNGNMSSSISESSIIHTLTQNMFEEFSANNITFKSDYLIYYYEKSNTDDIKTIERYDVTAKITEDAYSLRAYSYGTNQLLSSVDLAKNDQSYVVSRDLNIKNELVEVLSTTSDGKSYLWDKSVYFNFLGDFKAQDFTFVDETTFKYIGNDKTLPLYFLQSAIPVSSFDLDTLLIKVENNHIKSIHFKEVEDDTVYENCYYGRSVDITMQDLNNTTIEQVKPYEHSSDNDALITALDNMKKLKNYTITSSTINSNDKKTTITTLLSEDEVYQKDETSNEVIYSGYHKVEDKLYRVSSNGDKLIGEEVNGVTFNYPKFDFSGDIFTYKEEKDGYRHYTASRKMKEVLNYVAYEMEYSEIYYPSEDISIFVKDGYVTKIEFPVYTYVEGEAVLVTNQIEFSAFNETIIAPELWNGFVTEYHITSWDDEALVFEFENVDGSFETLSVGAVFDKYQVRDNIPFFLDEKYLCEVFGNHSSDDNTVYISFSSIGEYTLDMIDTMKNNLTTCGYTYEEMDDIYVYENIVISIYDMEGEFLCVDIEIDLSI